MIWPCWLSNRRLWHRRRKENSYGSLQDLGEGRKTAGFLPVQFEDEIGVYQVENNRAVKVTTQGMISRREALKLQQEPAYGNIAEIGFGVLDGFGVKPIGETLLDEKLGLHIAFGRSDHFGGKTSPFAFKDPENVVHIDWLYIPQMQTKIKVREVRFFYPSGSNELVMKDSLYVI